nr:glycine--tRNA ligase subunit beta [Oceanococcus sp. HetDA_MAG_MS8]
MSAPLLIEIGCEDLPARYQQPLATALADSISQGLDKANVPRGSARWFATPRRLAVCVDETAAQQPTQHIKRQGPALSAALKDGQPTPAGLGFARSCGVDFDDLEQIETPKGTYLMYVAEQAGKALQDLLPELFAQALKAMDQKAPKRMRWGSGSATFVRPVQWLVALHGSSPVALEAFGLQSSNRSFGHRFHAPEAVPLSHAADYEQTLREAKVWADFDTRRAAIEEQVQAAAADIGGEVVIEAELLDEVTALVEWPSTIHGRFDERFLAVPDEAVVLTIQEHQRYFPVFDAAGALLPVFITVANIESRDPSQVIAGNERVVRPRLEDALFFWEQDRKRPLAERLDDLARVTWAKGLGDLKAKAERIAHLAAHLAEPFGADPAAARQAGLLAKCDLTTQCVFEMPELQGIMGGHLLRAEGSAEAVATAVAEHYQPLGPQAAVPESTLGRVVAAADKLDTLAGYFSIDAIPTASKDPYGLRRAALGLLRILLESGAALSWEELLDAASFSLSPAQAQSLREFLQDRLRGVLADQGAPAAVVAGILDQALGPVDAQARGAAVTSFIDSEAGDALVQSSKRVRNILRSAQEADRNATLSEADCVEPAEQALFQALQSLDDNHTNYAQSLTQLATLQAPIAGFFESVMVQVDDQRLRRNRLALLEAFDTACNRIADFERIAGG